jgi:hypothetical protein
MMLRTRKLERRLARLEARLARIEAVEDGAAPESDGGQTAGQGEGEAPAQLGG